MKRFDHRGVPLNTEIIMKKIILFSILIGVSGFFNAQTLTASENYIYTRTYLDPVTTETPTAKQIQSVQYFDGLGRTKQQVSIKATVSGKDLVIPSEYDPSGRQTKSYLPVPVSSLNGAIQNVSGSSVNAYYDTSNAYSEALPENSPLGRVLKQAYPGAEWQMNTNNTVKFEYGTNSGSEVIRLKAVTAWNSTTLINEVSLSFAPDDDFTAGGYYKANTLIKKTTKDEDDKPTEVFTNTSGQTLLIRKVNNNKGTIQYLDTYYVYDEFGNLVLVVPPKAAFSTIAELNAHLNTLCYQYRYDQYNRLAEKKIPGKNYWESIVYDKQNRPVLTQDANQDANQWSFVKYDEMGRTVYSGLFASVASRASLQTTLNSMSSNALNNEARSETSFTAAGTAIYYTNNAFPTESLTVLSVNYYDSYPAGSPSVPASILQQSTLAQTPVSITSNGYTTSRSIKSLPTASYVKNIEDDSWSSSFIWYDRQTRPIGTYAKNYLGGYTRTESEIDFSGAILQTFVYHKRLNTDTEKVIRQRFIYDDQKRLKKQYHQVNTMPEELLAENTYNDLGQLVNKQVGNNLQSIDYTYNLRGNLIRVNDPANLGEKLFGYEIKFQNPVNIEAKYNGTITEVDWKTTTDNVLKRYDYRYDDLNRLTKGIYSEPEASVPGNDFYNETASYDTGGNILTLQRNAQGFSATAELIDNLTYTYTGNQLISVKDESGNYGGYPDTSGTEISYDDNGNMKDHQDKGIIQIDYNFLNLPDLIKFNRTYVPRFTGMELDYNVKTKYLYRADGVKLRKIYTYGTGKTNLETSTITDYLDGFQYEEKYTGSLSSPVLKFVPTSEGYYDFEKNQYIYTYTDHLGNVRLSYFKNSSGSARVLEENNYYPFGLKHTNNLTISAYNYQYNGKEYQKETAWNDFGARMYMSDIGRWGVIDPLAEQMRRYSPYNFAYNNPINFIDPDGMAPKRLTAASDDSPVDYQPGWTNPNWLNFKDTGYSDSYGFGNVSSGGGGSPLVNIILNFIRADSEGLGNFVNSDFEANGWHIIDALNLKDALTKLTKYLGNNQADNIYINAHGLVSERYVYDDNGELIPDSSSNGRNGYKVTGDTGFYTKLNVENILGTDLQQYISDKSKLSSGKLSSIDSLIGIGNYVKGGKNLIMGSCFSADDILFGTGLSSLVKSRDVFVNRDFSSIYVVKGKNIISFNNFINYNQTSREHYEHGWVWYRNGVATQTNFNIIMTKYGVKTIK